MSDKIIARTVGGLFLIAIGAYGVGSGLMESVLEASAPLSAVETNAHPVIVGGLLILLNSCVVAAIGVLLFPILRRDSALIALGYLVTRTLEAALLVVGLLGVVSLVPLSQEYAAGVPNSISFRALGTLGIAWNNMAYQFAMAVLGFGSVFFCLLLYRSQLVPRFLALWGLLGYFALTAGAVFEVFGVPVGVAFSIPGGLFELVLAFWLMIRGFSPSIPT